MIDNHATTTDTYSPLVLHGADWSIEFRLRPTQKIIRRGPQPPTAELVRAAAAAGLPAIVVELVQVVAACTPEECATIPPIPPHRYWQACQPGARTAPKPETTWDAGYRDEDCPNTGFPFDITPQ